MSTILLFDTNAWMDYFIRRSDNNDLVTRLVAAAYSTEGVRLCTSVKSTADVFYLMQRDFKQSARREEGTLTESAALAANEVAWACLQTLRRLSFIVPTDESDVVEAIIMRDKHSDYEDNLVVAAARRMHANCIVTSDELLLNRQPYPCLTPEEALRTLDTQTA